MAASFPSANNTFVPSFEASGKLIIGYSRNPKKFPINQWAKIVPVKKSAGYYLNITAEEAARVINADLQDFVWHDGQEAPMGNDNLESFEFKPFLTKRYTFAYNLGDKAVDQADWPVLAVMGGIHAQKAMTARATAAISALTTSGNWAGSTDSATNLGGGKFDVSGATDKFILKTFGAVSELILKNTLGVVTQDDLCVVINPNTARQMAECEELRDFLKQSIYAGQIARQDGSAISSPSRWGLPDQYAGIKIIVDNTVRVTSKKGATRAVSYAFPNSAAVFLARPGEIKGMEGIPEFSTCQFLMYEEMTVESKRDPDNRRTVARIVDDWDFRIVAPASGYYVSACTD